jgi:hypothetical protein
MKPGLLSLFDIYFAGLLSRGAYFNLDDLFGGLTLIQMFFFWRAVQGLLTILKVKLKSI